MPKSDFECVICGDGKFEALPRWVDDDSRICDECAEECVAPRFHKALEHEHHYPVMFGKIVLDIWTFWDLFDILLFTYFRICCMHCACIYVLCQCLFLSLTTEFHQVILNLLVF